MPGNNNIKKSKVNWVHPDAYCKKEIMVKMTICLLRRSRFYGTENVQIDNVFLEERSRVEQIGILIGEDCCRLNKVSLSIQKNELQLLSNVSSSADKPISSCYGQSGCNAVYIVTVFEMATEHDYIDCVLITSL